MSRLFKWRKARKALPHEPVSYALWWPVAGMWGPQEHIFSREGWGEFFSMTRNKVRFTLANGQKVIVKGRRADSLMPTVRPVWPPETKAIHMENATFLDGHYGVRIPESDPAPDTDRGEG